MISGSEHHSESSRAECEHQRAGHLQRHVPEAGLHGHHRWEHRQDRRFWSPSVVYWTRQNKPKEPNLEESTSSH
ncbi:hypothetical protein EVAR_94338_1 [Eumeta japonica]|uniref:Uncharacterized protein n=1 Tax=Eumeta variegata TaxID=151549 RepID=A0A4C1TPT5_EUMVA|nr:hypothetical protein EVAR_94338_1 [Eumeta japonica]